MVRVSFGGKSGFNDRVEVLDGRKVIAFPDVDAYDQWCEKAAERPYLDITVSDYLQQNATEEELNESAFFVSSSNSANKSRTCANAAEEKTKKLIAITINRIEQNLQKSNREDIQGKWKMPFPRKSALHFITAFARFLSQLF